MNKFVTYLNLFLLISLFSCTSEQNVQTENINLIPQPSSLEKQNGYFEWNKSTQLMLSTKDSSILEIAEVLKNQLSKIIQSEIIINTVDKNTSNIVYFSLDNRLEKEAYKLVINNKQINIEGGSPAGIFYAVQTLLQLMPAEIYKEGYTKDKFYLPAVIIQDAPSFAYRGLHMDVSRNFFNVSEVKKFIDLASKYKYNRFHWHLTDGAGWRIEIKQYPLLTKKAAFRKEAAWTDFWKGDRKFVEEGSPEAYGGYYTQEEVREIIQYAAKRYITIIPEIEMPGHSEEVFAAYPHLSCFGKYGAGDFCAGNDSTFVFLENILTEIMDLFPSEYIHIGGDEAGKSAWKKCPKCAKRMKDEKLKDVNELQSYFIKRINNFVISKGRNIIGWDEILEGGLAPGATVMSWRGEEGGIKTARDKHNVIMTPGNFCYFDHYQGNPQTEPKAISGYTNLRRVYSYTPIPAVLEPEYHKYILGGQANLWAEYIPTFQHLEYMAYPRAIALAEVLWSKPENRNWENFKQRLQKQLTSLDYQGVNYRKPDYDLEILESVDTLKSRVGVFFQSEQYNPIIRYTIDGSLPTKNSKQYTDTIFVTKPVTIRAGIFVNDELKSPVISRMEGYHLGIGKKITYKKLWTAYPAGGNRALIDGYRGGLSYSDNRWQGFTNHLDVVIDLGEPMAVNQVYANFMQLKGPGVFIPTSFEVKFSMDGNKYTSEFKEENTISRDDEQLIFKDFNAEFNKKMVRYINIIAKNGGGFIFTDEIIIN